MLSGNCSFALLKSLLGLARRNRMQAGSSSPGPSPEKKRTDRSVGLMVAVLPAVATNSWKKNLATKWGGDRMVAAQCSTIRGVRNLTEFGVWFRLQRQRRPK